MTRRNGTSTPFGPEWSKIPVTVGRISLGLFLVLSVLARVFLTEHIPARFSPEAQAWLTAMDETGYLTPLLLITELSVGLLLVGGLLVPLALVVFVPVNLNIFLFHAVLDPQPARVIQITFMALVHLALLWRYREHFMPFVVTPMQLNIIAAARRGRWSVALIVRTLVGLLFVTTGAAKIFGLVETTGLIAAMQETGYLYLLVGATEMSVGVMLLGGVAVPLALVVLAPGLLNVLAFHIFLDQTSPMALVSYAVTPLVVCMVRRELPSYRRLFA